MVWFGIWEGRMVRSELICGLSKKEYYQKYYSDNRTVMLQQKRDKYYAWREEYKAFKEKQATEAKTNE